MTQHSFTPGPDTARAFRDALGRYPTGVTVVTIAGPDGPMGFTANSFAALSLDPPLVLWSPARASQRFAHFVAAERFSIHVLDRGHHDWVARFARGGPGFAGLAHQITDTGLPIIDGALARFDCTRHATHEGGDHMIVVGRVHHAAYRTGMPLVFSQGVYGGFDPGN